MNSATIFSDTVIGQVPHELGRIFQLHIGIGLEIRCHLVAETIWTRPRSQRWKYTFTKRNNAVVEVIGVVGDLKLPGTRGQLRGSLPGGACVHPSGQLSRRELQRQRRIKQQHLHPNADSNG